MEGDGGDWNGDGGKMSARPYLPRPKHDQLRRAKQNTQRRMYKHGNLQDTGIEIPSPCVCC